MVVNNYLLEGEKFDLKNKAEIEQTNLLDNEINKKYRKGEMRIVTEQGRINLDSIVSTLDSKQSGKEKYILNPEYQRRKRWENRRKSLLIESFIMNVPVPPVFLYEIEYARYEVMDGLQRLTAIYDFYKGKYALEGLEYWKELNGRIYEDLPENVKAGIDRRYLSSIILLEETAKNKKEAEFLKQIVFERLNSGGAKLTPQETRNALHNGPFNQLCIELSKNDFFRKMWKLPLESDGEKALLGSELYREMGDVELVLRFFAYRHVNQLKSPIDKFLDSFLKQANDFSTDTINELKIIFLNTVEILYSIFEGNAFLLPSIKREHKSPSKTIYDPIMQAFAINITAFDKFILNKDEINRELYSEQEDLNDENEKYLFNGRDNNKKNIEARIEYFHNFLQKYTV